MNYPLFTPDSDKLNHIELRFNEGSPLYTIMKMKFLFYLFIFYFCFINFFDTITIYIMIRQ